MDIDRVNEDRMQARLQAADARLDELEASARARNAQAEMDEISGVRTQRDRFRRRLADARGESASNALNREVEDDWADFQRSLVDVHSKYATWDDARERRFNAHLDEANAALRRVAAEQQIGTANVRAKILEAHDNLSSSIARAKREYDAWRSRRADKAAIRELNAADLELDDAIERYTWALQGVAERGD